jgi:glycosyltransferase involved in cell wall biosynthesis
MSHAVGAKVVLLVAVDWYFCLHWLPLAQAVRAAGYDVAVMTEITDGACAERIRAANLRLLPITLSRSRLNPVAEMGSLLRIAHQMWVEGPDLLHAIGQKPVLYGALAARLAGVGAVVGTFAGLGYIFTSHRVQNRLLRPLMMLGYRFVLSGRSTRVIVQNPDDERRIARSAGVNPILIMGAGVDLERFSPRGVAPLPVTVVLASRMLWDKGVQEFVTAASRLQRRRTPVRMVLVGAPDQGNPSTISRRQLQEWDAAGAVEWWGHRSDMPAVLAQAHVVCLPSYREGLPTILLEAAAAGLPLIATDVPGCREVVRAGVNGTLVPARDAGALANAIEVLVGDSELRDRYGHASRRMAEAEFGIERVASATLSVYRSICAGM